MTETTAHDLIDVLVTDHREVQTLFAELETGTGDPAHRREHAGAEEMMNEIDGLDSTDPRFAAGLTRLMAAIRHHVLDEETDLLPRLRQACSPEELQDRVRDALSHRATSPGDLS